MKLTNLQIYNYASTLLEAFQNTDSKLPIKVNFYLLKNKNTLIELAREIDQSRTAILQSNGTLNEETNQYEITSECIEKTSQELNDLFSLEQDVKIYTVNIDSFGETDVLTTKQMEAILFMIED